MRKSDDDNQHSGDEEAEGTVYAAVSEHAGTNVVGVAHVRRDLVPPVVTLMTIRDTASHSATLCALHTLSPCCRVLVSKTSASSPLSLSLRESAHFQIIETPRSDFSETEGAVLLRSMSAGAVPSSSPELYLAVSASCALLRYLKITGRVCVEEASSAGRMTLSHPAAQHLELAVSARTGKKQGSLLGVLDHTKMPGGARLLRSNVLQPLSDEATINARLDCVAELMSSEALFFGVSESLKSMATCDLERHAATVAKLAGGAEAKPSARRAQECLKALCGISRALSCVIGPLVELLTKSASCELLKAISQNLKNPTLTSLRDELSRVLVAPTDGKEAMELSLAVRPEVDALLDVARKEHGETSEDVLRVAAAVKEALGESANVQLRHQVRRGFFFVASSKPEGEQYIDVCQQVPTKRPRKKKTKTQVEQELASQWTFTTEELASLATKNSDALDRVYEQSAKAVRGVLEVAAGNLKSIVKAGEALSMLDMLQSLASWAITSDRPVVRPEFTKAGPIAIKQGRHPILDSTSHSSVVPNDTFIGQAKHLQLITGANMSGKTTFVMQAALLAVMAHVGSFVPADFASFRTLDKLLTRIGAAESLEEDSSALMTEMREMSRMLNEVGPRSLCVIDEFGRATSPEEGAALAWAVGEHLMLETTGSVLFVTHFLDVVSGLCSLYPEYASAYHFQVERTAGGGGLRALHSITEGANDTVLGIEMAESAGLPSDLISRAYAFRKRLSEAASKAREDHDRLQQQPGKGRPAAAAVAQAIAVAESLASLEHSEMDPSELRGFLQGLKSSHPDLFLTSSSFEL